MEDKNQDPQTPSTDNSPATAQPDPTSPVSTPTETNFPEVAPAPPSETPDEESPPTSTVQPPKKHHGFMMTLVLLLSLLAIGAGTYLWLSHRSHVETASTAVVEKDIPNIRYVTTNEGWDTFYPGDIEDNNYQEANIMVFEGLVRFENKTQIVPLLATGWTNPDASTWVFNLKQGVKFHTGREMTAEDVKASFDDAKDGPMGQLFATTIKSVDVTGQFQVTIRTDGPDPTLLKKLVGYYVYDTKSGKTDDPINGTGPFVVKPGTTPSATSLELVAFDQYHGGRPHVRSFSFIGQDTSDNGKAYGDNKADLMSMPAADLTKTGTRPYASQLLDQTSVFIMPLNTLKAGSPLQKLAVRQALEDSLDPLAIAKVRGVQAIPATQMVPKSIPGFDPTVTRPPRDVAKAKQLLASAGYPNGFSMTLTYFSPSQTTADEIARELAESGVKVNLDPQTEVKTLAAKAASGTTDAFFNTFSSDIFDASDVLAAYDDSNNYKNDTVISLLSSAESTLDASKRLGYLQQASHAMAEDLGVLPIYSEHGDTMIYNPSYLIKRDIANNTIGIYFWKVYAK